ncbi:hypothetical protein E4U42_007797 [Claviceps africana]|uniref:GIT Spa2 homology (SHD) domain-containing protein n=1 Tax=Claviceps africana TaxID=83212 RepID=A0A8K0J6B1_9HYPO|nr:hypothetical protein E4U42_007797 [Claviceps africana]
MSAAGRNVPLSPISLGEGDWSLNKSPSHDDGSYHYQASRGNLASPSISEGFNGANDGNGAMSTNGFPSAPRSNGGPSPPPSLSRSSTGTNVVSGGGDSAHNSSRDLDEPVLYQHYVALKTFLHARGQEARQHPNKARDKLLRLSAVQFFELSTDVFDELIRRQTMARTPPNAPSAAPQFLLPEKTFHQKRNQARQRLSSLGPPRFRDLATDVYHELERRYPAFVGRDIPDIPRSGSSMSMRSGPNGRNGNPSNGVFPPRGPSRMRRPSEASSIRGGMPPPDMYGVPPSPSLANGDFGRPMPKQLNQNNTIVPNKSTMLEEDDDNGTASEADKRMMENYQAQIRELQDKLTRMEDEMKKKDEQLSSVVESERSTATAANLEKKNWSEVRSSLENKLAEAQELNASMKQELERLRAEQENQTSMRTDPATQQENDELRQSLMEQNRITEEVRRRAQEDLDEMRLLTQRSNAIQLKQKELEDKIERLEGECRSWRNKYARAKALHSGLRASTQGLPLGHDAAKYVREKEFVDSKGIIKDVHVTEFQISIDELLQTARGDVPEKVIESMKRVVVSVRRITRELDASTPQGDGEVVQQQGKLKARVSSTANGLITASKNFVAGAGMSPISLLDAAASNLSVSIIDLVRVVKIRPTPPGELEEEDDDGMASPLDSSSFFSPRSAARASGHISLPPPPPFQGLGGAGARASAESSAYSPMNSPRGSVDPYHGSGMNGLNGLNGMSGQSGTANGEVYLGFDKKPNGYRNSRPDELKVQPYGAYGGGL